MENKPVICEYNKIISSAECVPKIDVNCFPSECDVILYQTFCINNKSVITSDLGMSKVKLHRLKYVMFT